MHPKPLQEPRNCGSRRVILPRQRKRCCPPALDEPKKSKLVPIEGMPPDLSDLPQGCAFRARCRFAIEKCATEYPPSELIDGTDDHHRSCWINVDESAEKDVYVNR